MKPSPSSTPNSADNPNNCAMCDHKKHSDGGHCYVFRDEPRDVCMQHTVRISYSAAGFMLFNREPSV